MKVLILSGLLALVALKALPCTCVSAASTTAKTEMVNSDLVFRGTVIDNKVLPPRAEMKGRQRYEITFRIDEFWKGSPGKTVVLYGMQSGTSCGDDIYDVGKSYLVYASETPVTDLTADNFFFHGWTDVLPEGTRMLIPQTACSFGGKTDEPLARNSLKKLGKGRIPGKTN